VVAPYVALPIFLYVLARGRRAKTQRVRAAKCAEGDYP